MNYWSTAFVVTFAIHALVIFGDVGKDLYAIILVSLMDFMKPAVNIGVPPYWVFWAALGVLFVLIMCALRLALQLLGKARQ